MQLVGQPTLGEDIRVSWAGTPERDFDQVETRFLVLPEESGGAALFSSETFSVKPEAHETTTVDWAFHPDRPGRYRIIASSTASLDEHRFAKDEVLLVEVPSSGTATVETAPIVTAKQFLANAIWQEAHGTDAPATFDPERDADPRVEDFSDSKAPRQAGSFTVKATINYTDRLYTGSNGGAFNGTAIRPLRRMAVDVVDVEGGGKVEFLVSTKTSNFGVVSVVVPNNVDGVGEGTRDIQLIVRPQTDGSWVQSEGGTLYEYRAKIFNNWPGGTLDFGTINIPLSSSGPFNITDAILSGRDYAVARGEAGKFCRVAWGVNNEAKIGTSAYYAKSENGGTIHLRGGPTNPDEFDDDVILHEYGHFVLDKYSFDKTPGGAHSWFSGTSSKLAWSEGWASFFMGAVRNTRFYVDHTAGSQSVVNLETIHQFAQGDAVEGAVAGSLYDVFDSSSDAPDAVSDGISHIWNIMTTYIKSDSGCDIRDFDDGWVGLYYPNKTGVRAILKNHGIDYTTQAVDFPSGSILYKDTNSFVWWSGFINSPNVKIDVYQDEDFFRNLVASTPNDGSHDFFINPNAYPESDLYYFVVTGLPNGTEWAASEDYTRITDDPVDVNAGGSYDGFISFDYDFDWYVFNLLSKKTVTLSTTAGTLLDGYMTLYGPNSQATMIAIDDDSGPGAMPKIVRTLKPGTYYITVEGFKTTDLGTYTLTVQK